MQGATVYRPYLHAPPTAEWSVSAEKEIGIPKRVLLTIHLQHAVSATCRAVFRENRGPGQRSSDHVHLQSVLRRQPGERRRAAI